ncbi:hypothetical protein HNQ07_002406 [Deinococcus metalli]|uniref:Membrane protein 6-pyruvoyl-tetrahydropterin synthase-related domain-containing protein n=1 Tax=Deinococcus metalli TaxID=1141878 RepID=A0A7W8NSA4_9DEIO|nr:hypothetical protein [Deinococcus metalli]MBB5376942.1 hypothetical protein [Deinococcus metalli]GHF46468.1 hypothetical protein GCM10017781_23690 [Deinococcus metalli]
MRLRFPARPPLSWPAWLPAPSAAQPGAAATRPAALSRDERAGRQLLALALLLVAVLHGSQLLGGSFLRTYDALIHVFFGSHYAHAWFDPWEPRWYTGFSLTSYPPLSHYLIGALSYPLGLLGAFAATQLLALSGMAVGIYRFGKLLVPARAAGYGAVILVLSSSIAETVQVFGQLPTTLSLGLLLNAIPYAAGYIRTGRKQLLLKGAAFTAATTAAHHVTTLFGSVFFIAPVVLALVLEGAARPRPGEPQGRRLPARMGRRVYRLLPRLYRSGVYGALAITALVVVVLPYWLWSRADPITQVTIPHGSRENFLVRRDFGFMFWLVPWASLLPLYVDAVRRGLQPYRTLPRWPVTASILLLTLLGTGGTTPIPKLLLRGSFYILTLDRFTFWASILILPYAGLVVESWRHGALRSLAVARLGRRVHRALSVLGLAGAATLSVLVCTLTYQRKFQPDRIDVAPLVRFLEQGDHLRYRYMTLGFGDQMAWLAANTKATSPDGNYHSARKLPEMTTTPVERLEGAKYTGVPGLASLTQFLTMPEKYNLRFILSNDAFYDPMLHALGWERQGVLPGNIMVWEHPGIPALPTRLPRRELPAWQRLMWGVLPPGAAIGALLSLAVRVPPVRAPRPTRLFWVRWLREDSAPAPAGSGAWWGRLARLQPLGRWRSRLRRRGRLGVRERWRAALLLAAVGLLGLGSAAWVLKPRSTVQSTILAYWDAIDFKRFGDAYAFIEPQAGLTEERWRLDLSVVGGLRSGYAKLDSLKVLDVAYTGAPERVGSVASARVQLTWFTALGERREIIRQEFRHTSAGWRVLARPQLSVRPPERFEPLPALAGPPPQVPLAEPIRVLTSRVVAARSAPGAREVVAVVGEVENVGTRPAAVTITAALTAADGSELARNDAAERALHHLLPGERTPFLVRFDGAGMAVKPGDIAQYHVRAQGTASERATDRSLTLWRRGAQVRVENTGATEATITNVITALRDPRGVAWVTQSFLLEAVPPMQSRTAILSTALPAGYRELLSPAPAPAGPRTVSVVADAFRREVP